MAINPNIHDTTFKKSLLGLNKQEVYHYLYEVETYYKDLLNKVESLTINNQQLLKQNQDNMLRIYNLQAALEEATTVPFVAENKNNSKKADVSADEDTTVLTSNMKSNDNTDGYTTILINNITEDETTEESPVWATAVEPEEKDCDTTVLTEDKSSDDITYEDTNSEDITSEESTSESNEDEDEDVFVGEIEDNKNKAFRIGDGEDPDEGFTFL